MNIPGEALAWVEVLGWSLLHFLWQGLLIGLLFAFSRSLVARENSALRYAIGLLSLSALALCPLLTLWVLRPEAEAVFAGSGYSVLVMYSAGALGAAVDPETGLGELLPVLVLIWFIGVTVMVSRAVQQWRSLDRIASKLAWRMADIDALLLRVADRFGGLHGTRVLVSGFIDTPTLIGWFKPVILLPAAVAIRFPRHQLELILAHELGHLHRYDHLVNLGQTILETLLYYHPVVHWISREVRHEREICCDNLVLSLTESEPREYARTLAALEEARQMTPQLAIAASGGMLLDRVRRIIGAAAPHGGNRHARVAVWGMASCVLVVAMAAMLPHGEEELAMDALDQPRLVASLEETAISVVPEGEAVRFAAIPAAVSPLPEQEAVPEVQAVVVAKPVDEPPAPAVDLTTRITPVEIREPLHAAQPDPIEVADLEVQPAPLSAHADAVPSRTPILVRQVAPDYPDNGRDGSHARVGFAFSIDRAGRVRDIRGVSGDTQGAFAVAARNALRQWKFDPASIPHGAPRSYRQDFEFVSASRALGSEDSETCITPTGSHLCRPGRGIGLAFMAAEKAATVSLSENTDAPDSGQDGECVPQTGTRVCRPEEGGGIAMNAADREATSSHTIVISGAPQ